MKCILSILAVLLLSVSGRSQNNECNSLGVWLWHLEATDYPSYVNLALDLSELGVKRVYVKVADGRVDSLMWPELIDKDIIDIFTQAGIEPWAWSFNYPGNNEKQAEALYVAAQTGYKGFVIDIESQFDGQTAIVQNLGTAFFNARNDAINDGIVTDSMPLYVTTWGNPIDHNFHINLLDPYVDGYMPQTYLENWGPSFLENPEQWVDIGNEEYRSIGATKPIHHIISMEHGTVTADVVNRFFQTSGPMSSIWRIPGGGTPLSIREVWNDVDWDFDFCASISSTEEEVDNALLTYPNPFRSTLTIENTSGSRVMIASMMGQILIDVTMQSSKVEINTEGWMTGHYVVRIVSGDQVTSNVVIKI